MEDILALWDEADVVALGEDHGSRLDSELRLRLVSHPRFVQRVDFVVVEFANGHRQDVLDRYVAGETVPRAELVRIWRDTGFETWDSPIYEAFLTAIRDANAAAPGDRRVRVLAGDMAIDWERLSSGRDLLPYSDRGDFPTHIVDCRILAPGRKGLLVYGALHLLHGPGDSFVTALDTKYPGRVKTIIGATWPTEVMSRLRATLGLGAEPALLRLDRAGLAGIETVAAWNFWALDGFPGRAPLTVGEALDAIAYYGDGRDEVVAIDPAIYEDSAYRAQRERRARLRSELMEIVRTEGWSGVIQYDDYTCE